MALRPRIAGRTAAPAPCCRVSSFSESRDGLRICVLASGSKGNSIFIASATTRILFDAGLSGREIQRRMVTAGIDPAEIDAIVVSHEHSDHIRGVGVMARRFSIPVYLSRETAAAAAACMGRVEKLRHFSCGVAFRIGDFVLQPFPISHDAADPSGFTVTENDCKIGIATDVGVPTTVVRDRLCGCQILILEANHDMDMLIEGPYPWPLKQRIRGRTGHLSNEDAKELLKTLLHKGLEHVILAHLSETNNSADIAEAVIGSVLAETGVRVTVARQDRCVEVFRSAARQPFSERIDDRKTH